MFQQVNLETRLLKTHWFKCENDFLAIMCAGLIQSKEDLKGTEPDIPKQEGTLPADGIDLEPQRQLSQGLPVYSADSGNGQHP